MVKRNFVLFCLMLSQISFVYPNSKIIISGKSSIIINSQKFEKLAPGWHEFTWQGTDLNGQQVNTGMYLVTMRAGENIQKQKVNLLK